MDIESSAHTGTVSRMATCSTHYATTGEPSRRTILASMFIGPSTATALLEIGVVTHDDGLL